MSMRLISGQTFTAICNERGLTQSDIARSADVTKGFISQLVGGSKGCTAKTAKLIVEALGEPRYSLEHLFVSKVHPVEQSATQRRRSEPALPESA